PVVGEVIVVVHDPPVVVHWVGGLGGGVAPSVSTVVKVMTVPSGALTKQLPEPSSTLTVAVNVWFAPTRLVPFGVIWMLACAKGFRAGPSVVCYRADRE